MNRVLIMFATLVCSMTIMAQSCHRIATVTSGAFFPQVNNNIAVDSSGVWTIAQATSVNILRVEHRSHGGTLYGTWDAAGGISLGTVLDIAAEQGRFYAAIHSGGITHLISVRLGVLTISSLAGVPDNGVSITPTPTEAVVLIPDPSVSALRCMQWPASGPLTPISTMAASIFGIAANDSVLMPDGSVVAYTVGGGIYGGGGLVKIQMNGQASRILDLLPNFAPGAWVQTGPIWLDSASNIHWLDKREYLTGLYSTSRSIREATFNPSTGVTYSAVEVNPPLPVDLGFGVPPRPFYGGNGAVVFGNVRRNPNATYESLFLPFEFINIGTIYGGATWGSNYFYTGPGQSGGGAIAKYDPTPIAATVANLGGGFSITSNSPVLTMGTPTLGTSQPLVVSGATPGFSGFTLFSAGIPVPTSIGPLVIHVDIINPVTANQFVPSAVGSATQWFDMPPADPTFTMIPLTFQAVAIGPGGAFEITNGVRAVLGF